MELKRVIYVSEKTDFSNASLTNIYDVSQQKNQEESITGCLLIGSNSYLQVLEGPSQSVDKLYSKIYNDSRHKNVRNLKDRHIEERMFPSWSMKFSPFNNLEWSNKDFKKGNFLNIKSEQAAGIFDTIKDMTS